MVVMERRTVHVVRRAQLEVRRTDITFADVAGDMVEIKIRVRNVGGLPSDPTPVRVESAPFGAFVPWQPLARLLVPALDPGESRELTTVGKRPRPVPLGSFDRVPPRKLLTALGTPDQAPGQFGGAVGGMLNALSKHGLAKPLHTVSKNGSSLAPDLSDLLGRGQPYWAGNINVFIGAQAVERHVAKSLRIYPGRTNLAIFVVGSPRARDGYSFHLDGLPADWEAGLYEVSNSRTFIPGPQDSPIGDAEWVESQGGLVVMVAARPPSDCGTGDLKVHVTRRSDREAAIVEFNLDPASQGSGCYTV